MSQGRAEQLAARAVARARAVPRRHHRVAAVVVASSFSIVALFGLAVVAESAVPGDFLYPVDRAVEALGLDGKLLEERLEEAIILADRGDRDRVFLVAEEVLAEVNRSGVQVRRTSSTTDPGEPTDEVVAAATETTAGSSGDDTQRSPTTQGSAVTAAPAQLAPVDDLVLILRLEAENLLRTVRQAASDPSALGEVETAAGSLADAIDAAALAAGDGTTSTTSTSTTSSTTSTTSTSTTSTTNPTSSSTSTTVPGEGGGEDESEPGDGNGSGGGNEQPPITLPQP